MPSYVTRSGYKLMLNGYEWKFTGLNLAAHGSLWSGDVPAADWWAGGQLGFHWNAGTLIADAFDAQWTGIPVIRLHMAQMYSANTNSTPPARTWARLDKTMSVCQAKGKRVIFSFEGPGSQRPANWFTTGYTTRETSNANSYRDYVIECVNRYKTTYSDTILCWEMMGEAEGPHLEVKGWAKDVSDLIRSLDPDHLIYLSTIGTHQPGFDHAEYGAVYANAPNIDMCSYHDYGWGGRPGADLDDRLVQRIADARALNRPLIVSEVGFHADLATGDYMSPDAGSLARRRDTYKRKMDRQFQAGIAGFVPWTYQEVSEVNGMGLGPGDPTLQLLRDFSTP